MSKTKSKFPDLFSDALIDQLEHQPNSPYVPFSAIEEALRKQIHEYFDEIQKNIAKGYSLSLTLLKAENIADLDSYTLTKQQLAKLHNEEIMKAVSDKETTLAEVFEMGTEELSHLYQLGFDLFNQNNYEDARAIFTYLLVLHPRVVDFWRGLGCCFEQMHKDVEAVTAFYVAATLQPDIIDSYLPLAKLLVSRGSLHEARHLFEEVIKVANQLEDKEKGQILKEEAKKYMQAL